jgi:hypothetical protein
MPTYEVTCTVGGWGCDSPGEAIDRSLDAADALRAEGVAIEHDRWTVGDDGEGSTVELTARLTAPTEGTVGRHLCLAGLPASGIRRIDA